MTANVMTATLIAIGAIGTHAPAPVRADDGTSSIAVVGDVVLGGLTNGTVAEQGVDAILGSLAALPEADLAIANLESVTSARATAGADKSRMVPFYFRGRPETLNVLAAAGIDAVSTANNHAGDFGPAALLEQAALLDQMGVSHIGAGATEADACAPVYLDAGNDLRVALFGADATEPLFAAGPHTPGTCHLPLSDPDRWTERFASAINEARRQAHAVLFSIHWGDNWATVPSDAKRELGRQLIDLGVNVIIGANAHELQGIELHADGAILHDTANGAAPFDEPVESAIFVLTLTADGVAQIEVQPIVAEQYRSRPATPAERDEILATMATLSAPLGTTMRDGRVAVGVSKRSTPPAVPAEIRRPEPMTNLSPADKPPEGCVVQEVPADARISPVSLGPLTLVGAWPRTDDIYLPRLVGLETYWTIEAPTPLDVRLAPHGVADGTDLDAWTSEHDPCDWGWPTSRWRPGLIYRDVAALRPPGELLTGSGAVLLVSGVGGSLGITMGVTDDGTELARSASLGEIGLGASIALRITLLVGFGIVIAIGTRWWLRRRQEALGADRAG